MADWTDLINKCNNVEDAPKLNNININEQHQPINTSINEKLEIIMKLLNEIKGEYNK